MVRTAALALSCLALVGCGDRGPPSELDYVTLAQDRVKARLRDPGSAQFSEVRSVQVGGSTAGVCGKVNSKNGFGGMSGPKRFIIGGTVSAIEGDGLMDAANFDAAWRQICE